MVRGVALLGIALVNMPVFAGPWHLVPVVRDSADLAAALFTAALLEGKFYLLFAFMFGWGMVVQAEAARRDGADAQARLLRRMAGLLVFGMANAAFLFIGDILIPYALAGVVMLMFLNAPTRALVALAITMTLSQAAVFALFGLAAGDVREAPSPNDPAMLGTFLEQAVARIDEWQAVYGVWIIFLLPAILAAFAIGAAAAREDLFAAGHPAMAWLERRWPVLLVLGLGPNVGAGWIQVQHDSLGAQMLAVALTTLTAPLLSAVWMVAIVRLARSRFAPRWLMLAGSASLSAYLLQNLIASWIFNGHGLGLWGQFGSAAIIATGAGVFLLSALAVAAWVRMFGVGPCERVLRCVTRGTVPVRSAP
jgi:uncharacterized protein